MAARLVLIATAPQLLLASLFPLCRMCALVVQADELGGKPPLYGSTNRDRAAPAARVATAFAIARIVYALKNIPCHPTRVRVRGACGRATFRGASSICLLDNRGPMRRYEALTFRSGGIARPWPAQPNAGRGCDSRSLRPISICAQVAKLRIPDLPALRCRSAIRARRRHTLIAISR